MFFADSPTGDFIIIVITLSVIIFSVYNWFYLHWKRRNVPCLQTHFSSLNEHLGIKFKHVYNLMKQNQWKHGGVFIQVTPIYVVRDLHLLKNIMTKDFQYFPHRGLYYNEKDDPLSCHIFNTSGPKWRRMRTNLSQIFTPGKLKSIFPLLLSCKEILIKKIETEINRKIPFEAKTIADSFIGDVIESCVFGLDWQNFSEQSPIQQFGRKIFRRSRTRRVKGFIVDNFPKLGRILNIALIPKDASTFFLKIVEEAIDYRKKQHIVRHDFLQVLTELRNEDESYLKIEEIAAQCFIFFLAGMSTSPTAISFALYELARNEDIQERVREEVGKVLKKYQNVITYEAIQEMKYLEQVLDETLRKYPPAAYLNRKCVKDYKVFGTDVVIEKGTTVVIPVLGIHHDEEFYPEPEKFDPERFNDTNKGLRESYAFIPFGEGARICIGMRFGQIQSKLALISLLRNFKFTINNRTQEPLKMKKSTLVLTAESGIWLNANKL
ncbi:probable cytochrome P450 6a17 [Zophobas morio]